MKSRLFIVMAMGLLFISLFTGCSSSQSATTNTATATVKTAATPTPAKNYSSYTGKWVCKEKTTSIAIDVDSLGKVTGSITTVSGTHVPSSLISGTIKDGVLTSKLLVDETDTGTLTLNFTKAEVITGNVKLDKKVETWTLEQGEMQFVRY